MTAPNAGAGHLTGVNRVSQPPYGQSITTVNSPIVIASRNPPHGYRKKENIFSLLPEPLGACLVPRFHQWESDEPRTDLTGSEDYYFHL